MAKHIYSCSNHQFRVFILKYISIQKEKNLSLEDFFSPWGLGTDYFFICLSVARDHFKIAVLQALNIVLIVHASKWDASCTTEDDSFGIKKGCFVRQAANAELKETLAKTS